MRASPRKSLLEILRSRLDKLATRNTKVTAESKAHARPFQAISIFRGVQACTAARELSEQRFLARDAPALPLRECTMPGRCECCYIRHKDRRATRRRLVDFGKPAHCTDGAERRCALEDRRAPD